MSILHSITSNQHSSWAGDGWTGARAAAGGDQVVMERVVSSGPVCQLELGNDPSRIETVCRHKIVVSEVFSRSSNLEKALKAGS